MLVMHASLSSQVAQARQAAFDDAGDAGPQALNNVGDVRQPVPSLPGLP